MNNNHELITSRSNRTIIQAASLCNKKNRDELKLFLCEGIKLFREAVSSGADIEKVFITREAAGDPSITALLKSLPKDAISLVSEPVLARISTEKSPQGVICTVKHLDKINKHITIYNNIVNPPLRSLLLENVSDPGNVGNIIRTAAAFGFEMLILGPGCADVYNPRTVRASMGAVFRQPVTLVEDPLGSIAALQIMGADVFAATIDAGSTLSQMSDCAKNKPICVIIGNEGHGVTFEAVKAATGTVSIPMTGDAESLNAAVAAAIFMWELRTIN